MGFLVLIPFATLAGWIIWRVYRWLFRGAIGPQWRTAFTLFVSAGAALGIWFAFFFAYDVSGRHLSSFPIPTEILTRGKPEDPWVKSVLPLPVRFGAMVTDVLCGVAICLVPLAVAAFLKENKGHQDFSGGPRSDRLP